MASDLVERLNQLAAKLDADFSGGTSAGSLVKEAASEIARLRKCLRMVDAMLASIGEARRIADTALANTAIDLRDRG